MTRLAVRVLLILLLVAGSASPQGSPRRVTTIDALKHYPGFYHLQNVLLRGELTESGKRLQLSADDHMMRVQLDDGVSAKSGQVEVRGTLIDIGRLEPGDGRAGNFAEGREGAAWPRPGEELFIKVTAVADVTPEASVSSIRSIALEPWKFDTKNVTVIGNFRGRNLFGDLPGAPGKSKYDFVLRGVEGAIWVTNLRPKGNGFELDINRRVDSDRWLEVTGTIVRDRGLVTLDATKLALTKAPQITDAPAESAAPPVPLEPVQVVFSSPTDGEIDVTANSAVRIQFSRGLREPSVAGHVRVSYVGVPAAAPGGADAGLKFQASYDAASRAIQLRMVQPFEAFRTVKIELLDGLTGYDGGPVTPWTLTFTVGG